MPHHPITPLASAQINHDHLKVELVEPDKMPAMVRIVAPCDAACTKGEFQSWHKRRRVRARS